MKKISKTVKSVKSLSVGGLDLARGAGVGTSPAPSGGASTTISTEEVVIVYEQIKRTQG